MNMNNQEKNTYVKKHILRALLEMIQTEDFSSIAVSTLVSKAGVGRASFYRNFTSVEDVLRQESDRLKSESGLTFSGESPEDYQNMLIGLLDFYKSHADFYTSLYKAGLSNLIMETIIGSFDIAPELPNPMAYLNSSLAYMAYGWVIEWIKRGMQESGTELALMIESAQQKNANG